jgi:hypothetical protein
MIHKFSKVMGNILQKDIAIKCNNKILRQGTLLLLHPKDFYITFTIKIKGITKKYELPYPFSIDVEDDKLLFDYKIETLCNEHGFIEENIEEIKGDLNSNKLLNQVVVIELT